MTATRTDDSLDLLADVASSFATLDAERVRSLRDAGGGADREMWGRIADNGWIGIMTPEDQGGAGLGLDAVCIVARRLGRGCFPEPFAAAGVLAPALLSAAGDSDRLGAVISGELLAGAGWITADAVAHPDGSLSGASRFTGSPDCDGWVVAARAQDENSIGLYWVPAEARGLTVAEEPRADGTISCALFFERVEAEELRGPGADAGEALEAALDATRITVAAELVGIGEAALELTIGYLKDRKQFGSPIGSFQALQHRTVDIWMQLELAGAALNAAVAVHLDPDSDARARAAAASSAKARAALAAPGVCKAALQLSGAIAFTDEYDLGLYLNRALALAPWLGGAAEHRRRWAELTPPPEGIR